MRNELAGVEDAAHDAGLLMGSGPVMLEPEGTPALVGVDIVGGSRGLLDILRSTPEEVSELLGRDSLFEVRHNVADLGRIELVAGAVVFEFARECPEASCQPLDFLSQQAILFGLVPPGLSADLVQHPDTDQEDQVPVVRSEVDLVEDRVDELAIRVADLGAATHSQFATLFSGNPADSLKFGDGHFWHNNLLQTGHGHSPVATGPVREANQGTVNGSLDPERFTVRKRGASPTPPENQILNVAGKDHPDVTEGTVIGSFRRELGGTYRFTIISPDGSYRPGPVGLRWPDVCRAMDEAAKAYGAAQKRMRAAVRRSRQKPGA